MMPDREQLYTALRNADAAGDTAGAQRLASYIQSLPADTPAAPQAAQAPKAEDHSILGTLGATAGAGFGKTVLGAQRLYGKLLAEVDDIMPGKPAAVAGKPTPVSSLSKLSNWITGNAEEGKAKLEKTAQPYRDANPITGFVGDTTGSIVATLPIGGLLPAAARGVAGARAVAGIGSRTASAAGVGAAYGGVQGAINSNADTFGGMMADGANSALTSAAMGGALTPVAAGMGAVGSNIKQRLSKTSAAEYAKQKVAEALARDARGTLATSGAVNPLDQVIARYGKLGDSAVVADSAGRNTIQLLDTLATLPGRTKDAAANLLHARQATVGTRMRDAADSALGTQGQRLAGTVEDLITARAQQSAPLYAQVRQIDITPNTALADIVKAADDLGATKVARDIATANRLPFTLDIGAQGPQRWGMQDLDHLKQGVDQLLSKATRPDGSLTPLGHAYSALKRDLLGELDSATVNPQTGQSLYAAARSAFAGPSALIDAANAGKSAISRDESAILSMLNGMGDAEKQAFRIGAYEGLRGKLGMQGGQTEVMNMWKNPSTQEKLRAIFGSEKAYRQFAADVARESTLKRLQSVGTGSQTASRLAGMGDLDAGALADAGSALGAAKTGNILSAIGSAKNAWNRVATPQTVRDEMGQMLLSGGAEGKRQLQSLAPLVDQINRRNMLLSRGVGMLSAPMGSSAVLSTSQLPRKP